MMELLEKEEQVMMRHYKWWIGTIMTKALAELKIERIGLARPNAREAQNVYDRFKKQSRNFGFSMATEEDLSTLRRRSRCTRALSNMGVR